jgi:hypothetical protein
LQIYLDPIPARKNRKTGHFSEKTPKSGLNLILFENRSKNTDLRLDFYGAKN